MSEETPTIPAAHEAPASPPVASDAKAPIAQKNKSRWVKWTIAVIVLILALVFGIPWVHTLLNTVSTDDAYVNGHVTFVAPRVPGQVQRVFVDDNNRVHKGDLLVQLDKEPYQVQVNIAQAAVVAARADVVAAQAQARALGGQAHSLRFVLEHAIEDVDN